MEHIVDIKIIELEPNSYHLIVEAEFSNYLKGFLIIDTGASRSVFDYNFLNSQIRNENVVKSEDSMGINAAIEDMRVGILPLIKINDCTITNSEVALMDLSYVNEAYKKYASIEVAGLLGSDFFVKYSAVIDYGNKRLVFSGANG